MATQIVQHVKFKAKFKFKVIDNSSVCKECIINKTRQPDVMQICRPRLYCVILLTLIFKMIRFLYDRQFMSSKIKTNKKTQYIQVFDSKAMHINIMVQTKITCTTQPGGFQTISSFPETTSQSRKLLDYLLIIIQVFFPFSLILVYRERW